MTASAELDECVSLGTTSRPLAAGAGIPIAPTQRDTLGQILAFAEDLPNRRRRTRMGADVEGRWSAIKALAKSEEFREFADANPGWLRQTPSERAQVLLDLVKAFSNLLSAVAHVGTAPHINDVLAPARRRIDPLDSAPGAPPAGSCRPTLSRGPAAAA